MIVEAAVQASLLVASMAGQAILWSTEEAAQRPATCPRSPSAVPAGSCEKMRAALR